MLTWCYTPRSEHMVKHFFAKLFLCEKKSGAVQHAMLVHFLLLLCASKEVVYKPQFIVSLYTQSASQR